MRNLVLASLAILVLCGFGSCQPLAEDDSPMALASGQATMLLGGCSKPIGMGYEVCQLTKGQALPELTLGFVNEAEWAVSDCSGGLYKSGVSEKPGIVTVDLSGLQKQAEQRGFCWLRLEAIERYPSPRDNTQKQSYATAGGFIVEFLAPGYQPVPAPSVTGWCFEISRTTKGRTKVEKCR